MNITRPLTLFILYLLVIVLALMVVLNRHESRKLFTEKNRYEKDRDELNFEWSRLKLEESTLVNQVRVETSASQDLGMQKPTADNIKVIRE